MDYLLQELFCTSCHPRGFRLKLKRPGDGETKPIDKRQDFVLKQVVHGKLPAYHLECMWTSVQCRVSVDT